MSASGFADSTAPGSGRRSSPLLWYLGTVAAFALWVGVYMGLEPAAEALTGLLPVARESRLGEALAFFLYDTPKVLMLLALVVFVMGVVQSFFSPEKTRAFLSGRREGVGNVMAAGLGILTPFCSCSAIPLFIGFVQAGIPLGVTFSFLIAAPMVNEVALGLLFGLVGWQVALLYLAFGLGVAIVSGWVIGRLHIESWLQDWVRELNAAGGCCRVPEDEITGVERLREGLASMREIVGRVWLWILAGIAVGAGIHGYVPAELMARIMGAEAWWSVPAAIGLGIPMYSNAAGIIPVVEALLDKGAALGTTLAFMMAVLALSLPEIVILRKVLKGKLIAVFVAIVGTGIFSVGFLFNFLFG
ncbi:permease [Afifella sp. YEN Y35]|uniref:permease n=1 Tax=Afifella sp. YEN Y35 TaxID=3388337 RepID=UPI0039E19A9E